MHASQSNLMICQTCVVRARRATLARKIHEKDADAANRSGLTTLGCMHASASALDVEMFEGSNPAVYARSSVSLEIEQMRAAIAGDAAAMRTIYEREAPRLLRRLRHLCADPNLAQDLVQECFTRAFAGEVSFAGTAAAAPYLHGIALNLWRNELRKRERRRWLLRARASNVEPRALSAPGERQAHDELQLRLRAALASLRPPLREAFVLRVLEQLPLAEAATLTGVSLATLSRRARRAEAQVRDYFETQDTETEDTTQRVRETGEEEPDQ